MRMTNSVSVGQREVVLLRAPGSSVFPSRSRQRGRLTITRLREGCPKEDYSAEHIVFIVRRVTMPWPIGTKRASKREAPGFLSGASDVVTALSEFRRHRFRFSSLFRFSFANSSPYDFPCHQPRPISVSTIRMLYAGINFEDTILKIAR